MICEFEHKIFLETNTRFDELAIELFHFQYLHNKVYRQYVDTIHTDIAAIKLVKNIPFLPIGFFKTQSVCTGEFEHALVFESSGTTQAVNSRHYIKDPSLYSRSFIKTFELFYGPVQDWCILALLPSYLERKNSSLVMMAENLIKESGHPHSGFYLYDHDKLYSSLQQLENAGQKTLLIGVTFALLDFAERFPVPLQHTLIMETGGMKGRKQEIIRAQVHTLLKEAFAVSTIHSEYGMTELLSQAYSKGEGIFRCPPWMKIMIREEDDPFAVKQEAGTGVLNIIDLANIYSCSFIATDDAGRLYTDGSFEVLGRMDHTDIRGCSLLAM